MIIYVLKKRIKTLPQLNLIQYVPPNEPYQKPVALLHKLYVLICRRIGLLSPVINKVHCEVVHVKIPKQPLILLVLRDREIHKHDELLLLLRENRYVLPSLRRSQCHLDLGREYIDHLVGVVRLDGAEAGQLGEDVRDLELDLSRLLVALIHEHFGFALVDAELGREDFYFVQDIDGFFVF